MAKILKKDDILNSTPALAIELVEVPEWNGAVYVRELSASERDEYEESMLNACKIGNNTEVRMNFKNAKARLVVKCAVDENGDRLFKDTDATALGAKSAKALTRLASVIERLSGLSKKDIEELTKNSETAQAGDSPSV